MSVQPKTEELPAIPEKRHFSIGEVAQLCAVKTHVLRYWEQEFEQLQPGKRNGRRYYLRQDVLFIRQLYHLLYDKGFTIAGARQWLQGDNARAEDSRYRQLIRQSVTELEDILAELKRM